MRSSEPLPTFTGVLESITVDIPFALNCPDEEKDKNVDSCASTLKKTFEMSNSSFIAELATNSMCSFNSDLFSNDVGLMDAARRYSDTSDSDLTTTEDELPYLDESRDEDPVLTKGVSSNIGDDPCSEWEEKNAREYGINTEQVGCQSMDPGSRELSQVYRSGVLDYQGPRSMYKLVSSQASSQRPSSQNSMESQPHGSPRPLGPFITESNANKGFSFSNFEHKRYETSLGKSSEFEVFQHDSFRNIFPEKFEAEKRKKPRRKRFVFKMLACFCVAHPREDTVFR